MGRGRGGRGGSSGKGSGSSKAWKQQDDDEEDEEEYTDAQWAEWESWEVPQERSRGRRAAHEKPPPPSWAPQENMMPRPLAAQWRFVCRILQRHSPEERVHDPRRQIQLGDHIFVQHSWDFGEQHGIVCSAFNDDGHGRRGNREDSQPWVVFWSQETARLQCHSLAQFSKGAELFRVPYPHWVCRCYIPAHSTVKAQIGDEYHLESDSPEVVAKRANTAHRSGNWCPNWSQALDIEFCIQTKTGTSSPIEVHGRKTLASSFQWPLAYTIGGERKPSVLFAVGRTSAGRAGAGAMVSPPPGYTPQAPQWNQASVAPSQSFPAPSVWPGQQSWDGNWQANNAAAPPGNLGGISSKILSADAQEFVPGGPSMSSSANWDGIYQ